MSERQSEPRALFVESFDTGSAPLDAARNEKLEMRN
jgi:hypothetical protein